MIGIFYRLLLCLSLPAVLFRLEWRARREPEYGRRVDERIGRVPARIPPGVVWFHAVSAGETIATAPLIAQLASEFSGDDGIPFLVTSMTPTGSAQVLARLGSAVHHCYAPYDFPFALRTFFDKTRPRLLVLVETELWPNLIGEAHRRGVPVVLINARLSERSAQGYQRLGGLTRRMLQQIDIVACQNGGHLGRFEKLGLSGNKGLVLGSVKFDAVLPKDHAERVSMLRRSLDLGQRRVWIAGSTHSGEDEIVLAAHARIRNRYPEACLLLVPRHPARAGEICDVARRGGLTVRLVGMPVPEAMAGTQDKPAAAVVVWNTLGQLQYLYGLSDVAFLGGSLVPVGGHNPIEAALCGQPLVMGPHTWNFHEVAQAFEAADCLSRAKTAQQLANAVIAGFTDESARVMAGKRARQVVRENRGASGRLLDLLGARIGAAVA